MSDGQISGCAKFRTKGRLPALSYYYKPTGCSIWRSSQCMNGVLNNRSVEDEQMILEIGKTSAKRG